MTKLKRLLVFPIVAGLLLEGTGCSGSRAIMRGQSPDQEVRATEAPVKLSKPKKKFEFPHVRMTWRDRKRLEHAKDAVHDRTVGVLTVAGAAALVSFGLYAYLTSQWGYPDASSPNYTGPDASSHSSHRK